jgi:GTP-binding protein
MVKKELYLGADSNPLGGPKHGRAEIAIVGRSNVGKSTLLNAIVQSRVARTSRTPGRTQLLQFFEIPGARAILLDLPGLGYAKVPAKLKRKLQKMVVGSLQGRSQIKGLLLLIDIRRTPGDIERNLLDIALRRGIKVTIVATKADQLPKHKVKPALAKLVQWSGIHPRDAFAVSTKSHQGIEKLRDRMKKWSELFEAVMVTSDEEAETSEEEAETSEEEAETSEEEAETSDQEAETSDQEAETSDQEAETSDQEVETSDQEVETSDQEVETSDQEVETSDEDE